MNAVSITIFILILTVVFGFNMDEGNKKVAQNANEICPIKIGEEIPSAILQSLDGNEINIREIIQGNKSILIFYRGGWCPYCNLHLSELVQIEDSLINLGYKIIAISMDKPDTLRATLEKHKMKYELYSDSKADVCTAFGIAFKVDEEYIAKLKSYNMDIEASSGETHHILPVPAAFIVDKNGIVQFEYVNPNYKTRINSDVLLEIAKEL
ncbi:MAG: AhpC/TSA family protein [Ignavibacteriales bacterium]|nr:AhpC/TSA family protein [Ignavibacteriales bacterium]